MEEFRNVGADVSGFQSQMHSEYDSAESIADSDLEDGELRKMLASPLYLQNREHYESSRMPIATGKLVALFSFGNEEAGDQFKSSVFRIADPSNVGRSLLEGNKDHLLSQPKSELMRQEHQVGSLNNCISELQQHACAQRLDLEDAHHGYFESREQVRLQEELTVKEKVFRGTQIRSMHEMGEMKRAQEVAGTILLIRSGAQQRCVKFQRLAWTTASSAGLKATTRSHCFTRETAIRVQ